MSISPTLANNVLFGSAPFKWEDPYNANTADYDVSNPCPVLLLTIFFKYRVPALVWPVALQN